MRGTPVTYFQSLNRSFHIWGVDRSLFYVILGLCLPLAFASQLKPKADLIAIVIFIIFHMICVLITRIDNQMLAVYLRHIHYKKYYAPQAGIHSRVPLLRISVPFYEGKRGLV